MSNLVREAVRSLLFELAEKREKRELLINNRTIIIHNGKGSNGVMSSSKRLRFNVGKAKPIAAPVRAEIPMNQSVFKPKRLRRAMTLAAKIMILAISLKMFST